MYVCLCNGIKESELQELGRQGVRDVQKAFSELESEPVCTSCMDEAEMVLKGEEILPKSPAAKPALAPKLKLVG